MMKRGKHIIRNYMTLDYEFSGIRIQDAFMSPVDWRLTVNLTASEKKNKSKDEIEFKASTAFQKIYFWLETHPPSIAVVNVNEENDLLIANLSSNIMMYCPGGTSDDIIIQLLHSKMTALAEKDLLVGEMRLKASDSTIIYTFDCEDEMYAMPATTAEYYTEGTARDNEPWWSRNDGFCFEFIKPNDSTLTDEELFKDIVDPLLEFQRMMSETDSSFGKVKEPARIVQVEKWKPKTVE